MISFFKKLFTQKKEVSQDTNLIDILKDDHKRLIGIYSKINKNIQKNDFVNTQKLVGEFISEYNKHILLEDTKLYIELKEKYKEHQSILNTIKNIEKDMNGITKVINSFEKKYINNINNSNKEEFIKNLIEIGEILTQRIELEEERLYSLL